MKKILISIFLSISLFGNNISEYDIKLYDVSILGNTFENQMVLFDKKTKNICIQKDLFLKSGFQKSIKKYNKDISGNNFICIDQNLKEDVKYSITGDKIVIVPSVKVMKTQKFTNISYHKKKPDNLETLFSLGYDAEIIDSSDYNSLVYDIEMSPFVSGKYGVLSSEFSATNIGGEDKIVRDSVNYRYDDYNHMLTYEAGDIVNVSQSQRFGIFGLQIKKNFDLDSDFVTVPTLRFRDKIALPSKIDMYIDNQKKEHFDVRTGLADFDYYLGRNGEGDVRFEITDENGRSRIITFTLYNYNKLLKKGLSAYKVNIGKARKITYRYDNPEYEDTTVSGSFQYGITDKLTAGADVLTIGDAKYASASIHTILFNYAALFLSGGHGEKDNLNTDYYRLNISRNTKEYHFLFGYEKKNGDLVDMEYLRMNKKRVFANIKKRTSWGSAGVSYSQRKDYRNEELEYCTAESVFSHTGGMLPSDVRVVTKLSYQFKPYKDCVASLYLSIPLGKNKDTQIRASQSDKYKLKELTGEIRKRASLDDRIEYVAGVKNYHNEKSIYGNGAYLADSVKVKAGSYVGENRNRTYVGAEGSLNYIGGEFKASRGRDSSMALVDTDVLSGVGINVNGKFYGDTDKNGKLVVTDLTPYHTNEVSVDLRTLRPGESLKKDTAKVFAGYKTGHKIVFEVETLRDYSFYITDIGVPYSSIAGKPFIVTDSSGIIKKGIIGRDGLCYVSNVVPGKISIEISLGEKGSCYLTDIVPDNITGEIKSFSCNADSNMIIKEREDSEIYLSGSHKKFKHEEGDYRTNIVEEGVLSGFKKVRDEGSFEGNIKYLKGYILEDY